MKSFPRDYFNFIIFGKIGLSYYDFSESVSFTDRSYWKQIFYVFNCGVYWRVQ